MQVNQVGIGSHSIGGSFNSPLTKPEKEASETTQQAEIASTPKSNPEEVMNALNMVGMQNLTQINKAESKMVNPTDYLSAEQIADIEKAMMEEFIPGVEAFAIGIEEEFPNQFSEAQKYALGAYAFAQE